MKNKRTKLTAVLLSALMAVSTISSVAWAEDLFTDGESEEVNAEEVADNLLSTEADAELGFEDAVLVAAGYEEKTYDVGGNTKIKFDLYGVFPTKESSTGYRIDIQYSVDAGVTWADTFKDCSGGTEERSNCEHPQRDLFSFSWDNANTFTVYRLREDYETWENKPDYEKHDFREHFIEVVAGDCDHKKAELKYLQCDECQAVLDPKNKSVYQETEINPESSYKKLAEEFNLYDKKDKPEVETEEEFYKHIYDDIKTALANGTSYNSLIFELVLTGGAGHTFDTSKTYYSVTPPKDSPYWEDGVKDWSVRNNCTVSKDGIVSGPIDASKPYTYYKIEVCGKCGAEVATEIKDYKPDVTEGSSFIEAGVNVKGFIYKTKTGLMYWDCATKGKQISKDIYVDVVREKCEANASIIHVTRIVGEGKEQWIKGETEWVGSGHTWGSGLKCKPWDGEDQSNFLTKIKSDGYFDAKIGDDGLPIVVAKDCITDAYYTIEEKCYGCGINSERAGSKMQALKTNHNWDYANAVTDAKETIYTKVDELHHLEKYKDWVTCSLCHTRELQWSKKGEALVEHKFVPVEVENSRVPETCGTTGSYLVKNKCICEYVDENSEEKVIVPATDKHEWESTTPFLEWSGQVFINDGTDIIGRTFHVDVVRKCKICGLTDSNGINGTAPGSMPTVDGAVKNNGNNRNDSITDSYDKNHYDEETKVPGGKWCAEIHVDRDSIIDAKKDPNTGIPYPCSTAYATIYVDWVGTVDGQLVKINSETNPDAVKEHVPYYETADEYKGRTAHTPGEPHKEGDQIVKRCIVCGDIVSTEPDNTPSVGVPTVSATFVDYDTINVSWTKVEGATAYRLYYRSSDEGISKWTRIKTFTNDTSYPVNGLTTGSKYRFTVRAEVTQDGKTTLGDYSKKGAVAVPKLTVPEIKSVTASGKTTKVTWSRVDGASGYIVFRNSQRVGTVTKGSKVTWTDKKPVSGAKYQVRAYRTEDKKNYKSDLSTPK